MHPIVGHRWISHDLSQVDEGQIGAYIVHVMCDTSVESAIVLRVGFLKYKLRYRLSEFLLTYIHNMLFCCIDAKVPSAAAALQTTFVCTSSNQNSRCPCAPTTPKPPAARSIRSGILKTPLYLQRREASPSGWWYTCENKTHTHTFAQTLIQQTHRRLDKTGGRKPKDEMRETDDERRSILHHSAFLICTICSVQEYAPAKTMCAVSLRLVYTRMCVYRVSRVHGVRECVAYWRYSDCMYIYMAILCGIVWCVGLTFSATYKYVFNIYIIRIYTRMLSRFSLKHTAEPPLSAAFRELVALFDAEVTQNPRTIRYAIEGFY